MSKDVLLLPPVVTDGEDTARRGAVPEVTSIFPTQPFVRLGVHDVTRLEWSISLPLPANGSLDYNIEVELDIPANAFAKHEPWDQLQAFTRLDGPSSDAAEAGAADIDSLRRGAVAVAHRLSRSADGFARHCRLALSYAEPVPPEELKTTLFLWIDATASTARDGRAVLCVPRTGATSGTTGAHSVAKPASQSAVATAPSGSFSQTGEAVEIARERLLVDEYISLRLLKALSFIEKSLLRLQRNELFAVHNFDSVLADVESRLADVLEAELEYRTTRAFQNPDPSKPASLERYLERASQLKKHFQEVLFLEAETFQVAEKIHHWVAAFVAVIASTWAFAWQIALINQRPTATTSVSSGIFLVAVIAGLIYAAKDRIKEVGRVWISGNVHRFYAQRVSSYRAPERRVPTRDVVVKARESFDLQTSKKPDPLNPESGASIKGTLLRYAHKGTVFSQPKLSQTGVHRIKHVFRYDLSPVFARLDDAIKQIPILAKADHRVRFIDAPRYYRVPFLVRVRTESETVEERVMVVMHKRGLERIEKEKRTVELKESGLEPDHAGH